MKREETEKQRERASVSEEKWMSLKDTHTASDKTLLGLFVFLSISDESHLFWLTAMDVHIKERTGADKRLFLSPLMNKM